MKALVAIIATVRPIEAIEILLPRRVLAQTPAKTRGGILVPPRVYV